MQPCIVKVAPIFIDVYPTLYFVQHLTVRTVRIVKNKVYTWCDRSFLCSRGCPSSSRRSWCRFCCSFDGCFSCHWLFGRHSEKECKKTSLKSSYILQLSICKHHRGALGDLKKETISLVKIKILTNLLSRTLTCSCELN